MSSQNEQILALLKRGAPDRGRAGVDAGMMRDWDIAPAGQLGGNGAPVEVDEAFWGNKGKLPAGHRAYHHKMKIVSLPSATKRSVCQLYGNSLVNKSYRLPRYEVEFIESLARRKILGANNSDVVRILLDRAIKELMETEYVRKHLETMDLLNNRDIRK